MELEDTDIDKPDRDEELEALMSQDSDLSDLRLDMSDNSGSELSSGAELSSDAEMSAELSCAVSSGDELSAGSDSDVKPDKSVAEASETTSASELEMDSDEIRKAQFEIGDDIVPIVYREEDPDSYEFMFKNYWRLNAGERRFVDLINLLEDFERGSTPPLVDVRQFRNLMLRWLILRLHLSVCVL